MFQTYREAVAAIMPEYSPRWVWVGVGELINSGKRVTPRAGSIVVTTTTILGNRRTGYTLDRRVSYFRPVQEFRSPAEGEAAIEALAAEMGVNRARLRVLVTGIEAMESVEVTETPDGLGFDLGM